MDPWGSGTRGRGFGSRFRRGNGWRGGRGGSGRHRTDQGMCRYFQQTGSCRFGSTCRFSHELSEGGGERSSKERPPRAEETPKQQRAKADYSSWKRIIKTPLLPNDKRTVKQLWNGALTILNDDEREWKQMVPRDLDDQRSQEYKN
ncbi:hypothetical protein K469DRAFT_38444 [Zopfia rhizophila CBS 207.26]|uniref:C3H1-type domain-containing protein n=1 Tax=Zopfia rhizophila CBS 207.26 TaxID=1314779 RepID=A0A6A6D9H0_9PEZI|nr:hypothetical protein K469DRAFT_38444 [Zopfia rhizophila CBS 207.26]